MQNGYARVPVVRRRYYGSDEKEIGKTVSRAKDAKAPRTKNSKHEIQNSNQFQMTKICKIPNKLLADSVFWIFPD
jgi:hypothetical protein